MLDLFLLSVLVGVVLGTRLKVLTLLPAIGFFVISVVGVGVARGESLSLIATASALAAISLQLGYVVGSTIRFVLAASRVCSRKIETPAHTALAGDRLAIDA